MCCTYSWIFLRLKTFIGRPAKFSPFSSECQIFRKEVKRDIWTISGAVCASGNRTIVHHFFLLIFTHFFLLIFARPLSLVFIKSCLGPVSFGRHIEKGLLYEWQVFSLAMLRVKENAKKSQDHLEMLYTAQQGRPIFHHLPLVLLSP